MLFLVQSAGQFVGDFMECKMGWNNLIDVFWWFYVVWGFFRVNWGVVVTGGLDWSFS